MHELALCGSIVAIVDRHAAGRAVRVVRLSIGELRQVVPDTLTYCWAMVVEATPLAGSVLEIDRVAGRIRCRRCGGRRELGAELILHCLDCGSSNVEIVAGEEFLVTSIDVEADAEPASPR